MSPTVSVTLVRWDRSYCPLTASGPAAKLIPNPSKDFSSPPKVIDCSIFLQSSDYSTYSRNGSHQSATCSNIQRSLCKFGNNHNQISRRDPRELGGDRDKRFSRHPGCTDFSFSYRFLFKWIKGVKGRVAGPSIGSGRLRVHSDRGQKPLGYPDPTHSSGPVGARSNLGIWDEILYEEAVQILHLSTIRESVLCQHINHSSLVI